MSKILKKIVATQLSCYLESKQLLSNTQHGFRARLSTETALTLITNKIYSNTDNKNISLLTLCAGPHYGLRGPWAVQLCGAPEEGRGGGD